MAKALKNASIALRELQKQSKQRRWRDIQHWLNTTGTSLQKLRDNYNFE
jgi:hypothetical protein